jgi:hypothetical protein
VYVNDTSVVQLSKNVLESKSVDIPPEFDTFSPKKKFRLALVDIRDIELDVKYKAEETKEVQESMFYRIVSGDLDVRVDNEFSAEIKRITKKNPPRRTTIQMIFTGFDGNNEDYISPIFKDLRPYQQNKEEYISVSQLIKQPDVVLIYRLE